MTSIIYFYGLKLLLASFFILIGFVFCKRIKSESYNLLIGLFFLIYGLYDVYSLVYNYPSYTSSKQHYEKFMILDVNEIKSINISTEFINRKKLKNVETINNPIAIERILNCLKINNKAVTFRLNGWSVQTELNLQIETFDDLFEFEIKETTEKNTIIHFINKNNENSYRIGEYDNSCFKKIDLTVRSIMLN